MSGSTDLAGQTLPNELWIRVLEIASRPTSIIGDEAHLPDDIEDFIKTRESYTSAKAACQLFRHNKKLLRAVCRLWREIVDNMKEIEWCLDLRFPSSSILGLTLLSTHQPKDSVDGDTNKSRFIPRLNILVENTMAGEIKNYHPTSSLNLVISTRVSFDNTLRLPEGLSSFIADPTSLRSLHLTIDGSYRHPNNSLLAILTEPNIQLVTMSLKTSDDSLFNSPLVFPYLTTLSLSIFSDSKSPEGLRTTSWVLPSLINLSLEWNVPVNGKPIGVFVSSLLRRHSRQLRSLRAVNVVISGVDMASPSFWAGLPRLEVFATAFHLVMRDQFGIPLRFPFKERQLREALIRAWPATLSLRHLIQNDDSTPEKFIPAFIHVIEYCPKIETVSLCPAETYDGCHWPTTEERMDAICKLQEICTSRGVRILNAEGSVMVHMNEILGLYFKGPPGDSDCSSGIDN